MEQAQRDYRQGVPPIAPCGGRLVMPVARATRRFKGSMLRTSWAAASKRKLTRLALASATWKQLTMVCQSFFNRGLFRMALPPFSHATRAHTAQQHASVLAKIPAARFTLAADLGAGAFLDLARPSWHRAVSASRNFPFHRDLTLLLF
jgi:hypothetical protein